MGSSRSDIWIPIYIGDLLGDTQNLTNEQFGVYHKIIYHQWREGHLSESDLLAVCGFSGPVFDSASSTTQEELKQAFSRVLEPIKLKLSKGSDGRWFSPRCDAEKEKWSDKKRVFTERARKGGIGKEKRRRELLAKTQELKAASSSSSSVLETMLDGCTSSSSSQEEQKQQQEQKPSADSLRSPGSGLAAKPLEAHPPEGPPGDRGAASSTHPSGSSHGGRGKLLRGVQQGTQKAASTSKNGRAVDVRHAPFKNEVFEYWKQQNPDSPACPWNGSDAKALDDLLQAAPKLELVEFRRLLLLRAQSEVNPADLPRSWLRELMKFSAGSLDRFGKLIRSRRHL